MAPDWTDEHRARVDELLDEYRAALHDSLEGLTEEEARRSLVPSKTTLLGLVKHAAFVEGVWFDQALTGRTYGEIGIDSTVPGSFTLRAPAGLGPAAAGAPRAGPARRARRHPARAGAGQPPVAQSSSTTP